LFIFMQRISDAGGYLSIRKQNRKIVFITVDPDFAAAYPDQPCVYTLAQV